MSLRLLSRKPDTPVEYLASQVSNYLHLPDPASLYALMGAVAGNILEGPPVWLMLVGPPGCQPKGSYVLRSDGRWTTVENVQVGDRIASPQADGTSIEATVVETFEVADMPIYEIGQMCRGRAIKSYRCAINHTIPVVGARKRYVPGTGRGGRKKGRMVVENMTVQDYINRGNLYHKYSCTFTTTAIELPAHKLPVDPYVLGAMLGDGGMTGNAPKFTTADAGILRRMEACGVEFGKPDRQPGNAAATYCPLWPYSSRLKQLECYRCGSHDKFIPDAYKRGSIAQRLELLAGLIDTDGSVKDYSTVSFQLAFDFQDLVHSVGGYANINTRITRCDGKEFYSYRVHYCFGEHVPTLTLTHKNRVRTGKLMNIRHKKLSVTECGRETVYGFRLDSPSQWYVTDDWLVTHNCGKTEMLNSLGGITNVHGVDSIDGPAAFLSGTNKKDQVRGATGGLLHTIGQHGGIVIKDFTGVLSLEPARRRLVLDCLRQSYDGRWARPVGSDGGKMLHWPEKPGEYGHAALFAGVTGEIDQHHQVSASLGERWLYFRFEHTPVDQFSRASRAMLNSSRKGWRRELQDAVTAFIMSQDLEFGTRVARRDLKDGEMLRIIRMSGVAAMCRSAIPRDPYRHDVIGVPETENFARISTQMAQLFVGMEYVGVVERERWRVLAKIALDSMPLMRRLIVKEAIKSGKEGAAFPNILKRVGASEAVVRRAIEDLELHGVVVREGVDRKTARVRLSDFVTREWEVKDWGS